MALWRLLIEFSDSPTFRPSDCLYGFFHCGVQAITMAHTVLLLTSRLCASDRAVAPCWPAHPTFNISPLLQILELHSNSYGLYGPGLLLL